MEMMDEMASPLSKSSKPIGDKTSVVAVADSKKSEAVSLPSASTSVALTVSSNLRANENVSASNVGGSKFDFHFDASTNVVADKLKNHSENSKEIVSANESSTTTSNALQTLAPLAPIVFNTDNSIVKSDRRMSSAVGYSSMHMLNAERRRSEHLNRSKMERDRLSMQDRNGAKSNISVAKRILDTLSSSNAANPSPLDIQRGLPTPIIFNINNNRQSIDTNNHKLPISATTTSDKAGTNFCGDILLFLFEIIVTLYSYV